MIESDYINDILEFSIEKEKYSELLFAQIAHLCIQEVKYTGVGCYYYFEHSKEIEKFRLNENQILDMFGKSSHMIQNIYVTNEDININAQIMVWLENGLIDCIEIWNGAGEYPKE
jgi:hypothetical protein